MNKKLLVLGVSALAVGFFALTAFDGKTLEQQKAEIAQTVTMKLDELRATKEQECTDKVNAEAQRRFDEIVAQRAAEAAAKPGKKPTKKPGSKGPKVDPLPTTPKQPESNRERGDATGPGTNRERGDAVPPKSNRERGDVKKPSGGN